LSKEEILTEGYLAAYITGDLAIDQIGEIESLIQSDEEVAREYRQLQHTLEQISFQYGIPPQAESKKKVMENESIISGFSRSSSYQGRDYRYPLAASITLLLASTLAAFYFWNLYIETDNKLAEATIQNIELVERYQQVNQELDGVRQDLAVIVSPEFSRIILSGTDNTTNAKAVIYWNSEQEEVYLHSTNLAVLSQGLQYQLWALIDGEPIDMGVFDAKEGAFQVMKSIGVADAFAVTIEKAGGSESPTLSTMQVYGSTAS